MCILEDLLIVTTLVQWGKLLIGQVEGLRLGYSHMIKEGIKEDLTVALLLSLFLHTNEYIA